MGIAGYQRSVVMSRGASKCLPDWWGPPKAQQDALDLSIWGLQLSGTPAHAHTSGGGLRRDSLPLPCWSWWVGQGDGGPEYGDKCMCAHVCVSTWACIEFYAGGEEELIPLWRAAPSLHPMEKTRYTPSQGTPSVPNSVLGPPSLQKVLP